MAKQPGNIHDSFFKKVLGDPESASAFLREHLPPEIVPLLGDGPPELLSGSFVDEELGQHQSDLLFHLRLKDGSDALVYLVVEHKSSPDPLARLQLLRYVTRVLADWYRDNKRLPLPPVLTLLAHHGPAGWTLSTEFADLFGPVPGPLRPYLLSFRHALVDLARIAADALSQHIRLRAFLKALKYILRPDLAEHLDIVLAETPSLDTMDVVLILTYIDKGSAAVSDEGIRAVLHRLVPGRTEEIMGNLTQPYYEEGKARGRVEGRMEGEAKALVRLLQKRFGSLPTDLRERILAADESSIETWLERVIDAPDLLSVFEMPN